MAGTHATTRNAVRARGNGGGVYNGGTVAGTGMKAGSAKTPKRVK
jgi:hypothetical protein